jgi:hypothetical protein
MKSIFLTTTSILAWVTGTLTSLVGVVIVGGVAYVCYMVSAQKAEVASRSLTCRKCGAPVIPSQYYARNMVKYDCHCGNKWVVRW